MTYVPWYDTGHTKNDASKQLFYCCVYIRYRGNVSTEPLPSNDSGIHTDSRTDGRDFLIRPLRWAQVPWYTYYVS
jgi:hypothetical protein